MWPWDWRRHWCGEDSLDLSSWSGLSGACPGSVLLVGMVPGACPLKIPHKVNMGPGVGVAGWRDVVRWGRMGRSRDVGVPTSSLSVLVWFYYYYY